MRKHTRRRFLGLAGAAAVTFAGSPLTQTGASEKAKTKIPFELGLASYTLRKFSLDETIKMTCRVGLKHVCLKSFHLPMDATAEQCAEAAAKCRAAGLDLYGCGVVGMSKPAEVDQAFDYAKAAGMRVIVGSPHPDVLPLVDKKVKQYDIAVAIHNHGPGDNIFPTPKSAYDRIKDLDPRIGLCMDIGHTLRIGADPVADAKLYADRLLDVHVKDVSEASAKGETLEIGRGVIDVPAFLRTLIETNYSRIVSFEYEKDADDPMPGLSESIGYVKGVLATL
jgi:sugar phosphate isomerase/epimerase